MAKAGLKVGLMYKFHYIVNLFAVPVSVLIYYYLWSAIFNYSGSDIIRGFKLSEMVTYYAIAMIVGFITWTDVDAWIEDDIIQGYMVSDLMKPMTYIANSIYFTIGMNWLGLLIQFIPVVIVGSLFGITMVTGWYIPLFIISVVIAAALYFMIAYLIGLTAFWLKRISGIRRVRRVVVGFLSGSFIPLTFFPPFWQKVFSYLPFAYMKYTPVSIYMGKVSLIDAGISIIMGIVWVMLLYWFGLWLWKKGLGKFTGAGT